jgi:FKBP-type peptidyl-prolyl cis-trans isomerase 2
LIKGFENALVGMEINESKTIEVSPEEGYGNRIDMLVQEIPKEQIGSEVNVGDVLQASGPQGNIIVKVIDIMENSVLLDANHPLAGKTLYFDIEVLEINS